MFITASIKQCKCKKSLVSPKCIVSQGTHLHRALGGKKPTGYWRRGSAWGRDEAGAIRYDKMLSPAQGALQSSSTRGQYSGEGAGGHAAPGLAG